MYRETNIDKFKCEKCKFSSYDKFNYNKHCLTKKHLKNVN